MPAHAATGADPAGSSHPAKPVEGGNSAEMEAGFAAVLRTVVLAKTKASVRMVSFKIFKPKETSLSLSQVFKNSAKSEANAAGSLYHIHTTGKIAHPAVTAR